MLRTVIWSLIIVFISANTVCFAGSKYVDMSLTVLINVPIPCVINGGTVEFGNVVTTKVDGEHYTQPVNYAMDCQTRISDYLKLQLQGETTVINGEQVLKTNIEGFGLRLQNKADKTVIKPGTTDWLNFTYTQAAPELEVVPVKEASASLQAAEFNATATMVVDYQ